MTENIARQPQGVPVGGQFAPTFHAEPEAGLTTAPERKNQGWYDVADELIAGGRTPEAARCGLASALVAQMGISYLNNAKQSLAAGHETDAALYTIAFTSMRDLPSRMEAADNDPDKTRQAVTASRDTLRRTGSMLDMIHPSGRQPAFKAADDVMADLEEFLTIDTMNRN